MLVVSTYFHVCQQLAWLGFFPSTLDMPEHHFNMPGSNYISTNLYLEREKPILSELESNPCPHSLQATDLTTKLLLKMHQTEKSDGSKGW